MKNPTFSGFIFLILLRFSSSSESDLIVETLQGPVRGTSLRSVRSNRPFLAFMGIPYAKPPIGELRFKAPQPAEPWTEVRNATTEGSACSQVRESTGASGAEDCLFLNVFTPKLSNGTLLNVMVWIHGGSFVHGSSSRASYGPDFIVDEDVLLVTINYRLGILGFLSLQNAEVPGNNGLKDQVMALRWVNQNIARFGGDPGKVTIAGNSAGAASVEYHILSPMSRGLFQSAILQSGSVMSPWAFKTPDRNMELAFRIGRLLGVNTTDKDVLLQYLRTVPHEDLMRVNTNRELRVKPTIDLNATENETFLRDKPLHLLNIGNFSKVPVIAGVTSREGILMLPSIRRHAGQDPQNSIEKMMAEELDLEEGSDRLGEAASKIKGFYFGGTTYDNLLPHINMISDVWFTRGVYCAIKRFSALLSTPVYAYKFSFSGVMNVYKHRSGGSDLTGASHSDEVSYIFSRHLMNQTFTIGTPEFETSRRMVKLWTNFAKTGNPTPDVDSLLQNVTWTSVTPTNLPYLDIDAELSLRDDMRNNTMNFWDQLIRNHTTHSLCE